MIPEALAGKLLLSFAEAARILGVSRSFLYEMNASGQLGPLPVTFGRKTLFAAQELAAWVAAGCPGRTKWLALQAGSLGLRRDRPAREEFEIRKASVQAGAGLRPIGSLS